MTICRDHGEYTTSHCPTCCNEKMVKMDKRIRKLEAALRSISTEVNIYEGKKYKTLGAQRALQALEKGVERMRCRIEESGEGEK